MFGFQPQTAQSMGSTGSRERSRTPHSEKSPLWSTGNPMCDQWIRDNVSTDVLGKFAEMPQGDRKRIILGCINAPPNNVDAWIGGCYKNYQTKMLERRLTDPDSPQRLQAPAAVAPIQRQVNFIEAKASGVVVHLLPTNSSKESCALAKCWPEDKSSMIEELVNLLDESTVDKLFALTPLDQAAIAFTTMLTGPERSEEWSQHVSSLLDRFLHLRGHERVAFSNPSSAMPAAQCPIEVQFIIAGFSGPMALSLVTVVQKTLQHIHGAIRWTFPPVLFLRDGTADKIETEKLNGFAEGIFMPDCNDLDTFSKVFVEYTDKWKRNYTKFVFVSNVGFAQQPDFALSDLPKHFLHEKENKWVWQFLAASISLRSVCGNTAVADVIFAPPSAELKDELNQMWGEETVLSTPRCEQVSPVMPAVHSTPAKFGVTPVLESSGDYCTPIGSLQPPDLSQHLKARPEFRVAPSLIAKLLVTRTFKERPLSKDESNLLEKFRTPPSSQSTYTNRAFFMRWYGLAQTHAESILDEELPCFINVVRSTGAKASSSKFATPCGQERYCRNCEKLFQMLDRSYALHTMADVILALITKAMPTWQGQAPVGSDWERTTAGLTVHYCGPECAGQS